MYSSKSRRVSPRATGRVLRTCGREKHDAVPFSFRVRDLPELLLLLDQEGPVCFEIVPPLERARLGFLNPAVAIAMENVAKSRPPQIRNISALSGE